MSTLQTVLPVWTTVFGAICLQATPFVVLGAMVSVTLTRLPAGWPQRWLPRRSAFAVPLLGLAGTALPGCECGSVSAAAGLMRSGVAAGPAVSFMLAAPAVNPVVLAATAAAYPGQPEMVAARFAAGLLVAVVVGGLVAGGMLAPPSLRSPAHTHETAARTWERTAGTVAADLSRSLGLLVLGAAAAASASVGVPTGLLDAVARRPVVSVVALAAFATVVCICSQADAFVARSFVGFSRTAQFAFMIAGTAVDLKLLALQTGEFGTRFSLGAAAAGMTVALVATWAVAAVLL